MPGSIRVPGLLTQTCGPTLAPPEACQLLDVVSLWWQIQLDPKNRMHDERFQTRVRRGHRRHRGLDRAGAHTRGSLVLPGRRVRGARAVAGAARGDGWPPHGTESASRTRSNRPWPLTRRCGMPTSASACITTTPTSRRRRCGCFDGFCCCPAGDRVQGLEEMLRARKDGQLLQSEADYQLHLIYLWYEKQPQRALAAAARPARPASRGIRCSRSSSPTFRTSTCTICRPAARPGSRCSRRREAGRVAEPEMTEAAARLGLAGLLDRLSDSESALPHLRAIVETKPAAPLGIVAQRAAAAGTARSIILVGATEALDGVSRRAREHSCRRSRSDRERARAASRAT